MPRLLLHAGTHKTGTTSIQKVMASSRPWLRQRGVLYPGGLGLLGRNRPHHRLAHGLVNPGHEDHAQSLAYVDALRARAAGFDVVVISSEPIYRHIDAHDGMGFEGVPDYWPRRRAYLERVAAAFNGFEIEALLFFRDPDAFVASYAADERRLGRSDRSDSDFRRAFAPMLEYGRQIDLLRRIFPRVTVIDYDRFRASGGSVPPFFATLGVPVPQGGETVWTRTRPDQAEQPAEAGAPPD